MSHSDNEEEYNPPTSHPCKCPCNCRSNNRFLYMFLIYFVFKKYYFSCELREKLLKLEKLKNSEEFSDMDASLIRKCLDKIKKYKTKILSSFWLNFEKMISEEEEEAEREINRSVYFIYLSNSNWDAVSVDGHLERLLHLFRSLVNPNFNGVMDGTSPYDLCFLFFKLFNINDLFILRKHFGKCMCCLRHRTSRDRLRDDFHLENIII